MQIWIKIKNMYRVFTSDLGMPDMIRILKDDASNTYQFYIKESEQDPAQPKQRHFFRLVKNLFLAFIQNLTPVRRLAYIVALALFFSGLNDNTGIPKMILGFLLLNILLAAELADKLLVKDELDIARNIQINMMPKKQPQDSRFDMAFRYESANTVGGDFYDFIVPPNNDGFVAVVGDISGKGMEAALRMVQVHALLHGNPYPADLKKMLLDLNLRLKSIFPANQFLTANFLKVPQSGPLEFFRAGHVPLYYFESQSGRCESLTPPGLGLGFAEDKKIEKSLKKALIKIHPGDVLCLCTDGVIETENAEGHEFGEIRLMNAIQRLSSRTAEQIMLDLLSEIKQFRTSVPKKDDLTLLILKVK
jgi:sigma-B regulation protein RsbU (phosphoserine phosphatase)